MAPAQIFLFDTIAMLFVVSNLAISWIGLAAGMHVSGWALLVAGLLSAAVVIGAEIRHGRWRAAVRTMALVAIVYGASIFAASQIYDTSYDGMAYHQVSVIALAKGWNPFSSPHVLDWWAEQFPELRYLGEQVADKGMWSSHYPSGAWVLGAEAARGHGTMAAAKWLQFFLVATAGAAFFRGLRDAGLDWPIAAAAAVPAVLSPVALSQLNTGYVDGPLASILTLQVGASLSWIVGRRKSALLALLMGFVVACNLKFTGVVYSGAILAFASGAAAFLRRRVGRSDVAAVLVAVGCLAITAQVYAHNLIVHGHFFYPVNVRDVVAGQISQAFLDRPYALKLAAGLFNEVLSASDAEGATYPARLVVPKLWHYQTIVRYPEVRLVGFGSIFGYALAISFIVVVPLVWKSIRSRPVLPAAVAIFAMLLWITATVVVNPASWWARYVPQLWMIPILVAVLAWISGWRRCGWALLFPSVISAALCIGFWLQVTAGLYAEQQDILTRVVAAKGVALVDEHRGGAPNFVAYHVLLEHGVTPVRNREPVGCDVKIGFALACLSR